MTWFPRDVMHEDVPPSGALGLAVRPIAPSNPDPTNYFTIRLTNGVNFYAAGGAASGGVGTVDQGAPGASSTPWFVKLVDGSSSFGTQSNPIWVTGSFASAGGGVGDSVSVTNFPAVQAITGSVKLTEAVSIAGPVSVSNFPATQVVSGSNWTPTITGSVKLTEGVSIAGSVSVGNFPATQTISGSNWIPTVTGSVRLSDPVAVSNFPANQAITFPSNSTPMMTSVTGSLSSQILLAANASRKMATFFNDSPSSTLFLALANNASTDLYTVRLGPGAMYELPIPVYSGVITAVGTATTGSTKVTEFV